MNDDLENSSRLTRGQILRRGGLVGLGVAGLPTLAAACGGDDEEEATAVGAGEGPEKTGRKVIFVTHDLNPFFIPVIKGFEAFGRLRGWDTQFNGPPKHDVQATVDLQANAIAAKPAAVGFTRVDTTSFDENIKRAQEQGIVVILYNTASDGYLDLGVAFVGQEFISAGIVNGLQAAKHAQRLTGRKDGKIVMGTIAPGHSALEQRMQGTTEGVEQYNKENGTSFTTETIETSTDQAQAVSRIEAKWTADQDEIVGWAHADFVHWFTGIWAQDKGLVGKFANGGFDLVPGVIEGIQNDSVQWSIGQNPYAQGWVSSALIDMQLEAGFPPFSYDTGAEIVDKSNIEAVAKREAKFAKE